MGSGNSRNDPCWCGSGKKLKQCHRQDRQPRHQGLTLDFGRPVAPLAYFDTDLGSVQFCDEKQRPLVPEAAWFISEYDRAKGPKVLFKVDVDPERPLSLTLAGTLRPFDRIYLIDTNSADTDAGRLAVSAVYTGRFQPLDAGRSLLFLELAAMFEFRGVRDVNPERLGWLTLVEIVRDAPDYDFRWRIAMIVDSELSAHSALNARTEPLYADFRLPITFQLLYASDKGSDTVFNKIMRQAHHLASDLLEGIRRGAVPNVEIRPVPDPRLCSGLRVWTRTQNPERAQVHIVPVGRQIDSLFRVA